MKTGTTTTSSIDVKAREIDFVTRFSKNWQALKDILGITNTIEKENGTVLRSYEAKSVNGLQDSVAEGEEIQYTEFEVVEKLHEDIEVKKYAKGTTIEAVNKFGATVAIEKTDEAFLNELQTKVLDDFYTFLKSGLLVSAESSFAMALAMAKARVIDKFNKIRKNVTEVVGFVNVLDVYKYIGAQNITVQTMFGLQYLQDFMGYKTLFLLSEPDIPQGMVIATPVDNIDLYHINPANSDYSKLGLHYTVDGETNLIGFHANGNYSTAVGEVFALMGMKLWAEYIDAVSVVTVTDNFSALTVQSEIDSFGELYGGKVASDLQTNVAVGNGTISGTLKFIEGGLAESGPLAGDGYFLALKWSNPNAAVTSLKVGLVPSASGMDLVECLSDTDRNGVFKVTNKDTQKVVIVQSNGSIETRQQFALRDLVLENPLGA